MFFRRVSPQITNPGGLWDESGELYPLLGATPRMQPLEWEFPAGARVRMAHMQYEQNRLDWQGAQIPLICWDELTHFTESQFWYLLSRNRSTCGVRPYVRATCNPDPDSFVAELIAWWLDDEGYPRPERAGVLRYFVRINDELVWADTAAELRAKYPEIPPKSLTFQPSKVDDNPALLSKDPGYKANLLALPYVERMRLLGGNWKIRPSAGTLFNRAWVSIVKAPPAGGTLCRFWDFAATEKKLVKDDPDYTASCLMLVTGGRWCVLDVTAEQISPTEVERQFINTSRQDAIEATKRGLSYRARWEMEPGSAAKRETRRLVSLLAGLDAKGVPSHKDKITRAKPFLAQAEAGNVSLVEAKWNEQWLQHMHNQPEAAHDDIWDATAGAFNALTAVAGGWTARSFQG